MSFYIALVLLLAVLFPGGVLLVHLRPARASTRAKATMLRLWRGHSPRGWDDGTVASPPPSSLRVPPLPGERCDRCRTAAAAAVYLPGGVLSLCGHHGRQYEAVLHAQGAVIVGSLSFVTQRGSTRAPVSDDG